MIKNSVETFLEMDASGVFVRIGRDKDGPKFRNRDDIAFLKDGGTSSNIPSNWKQDSNGFVYRKNN